MFLLPGLVLALSVLALPGDRRRDVLGLLTGDNDTSTVLLPTRAVLHTLKPSTRSSVSPSATSQSSRERWTPTPTLPTDTSESTALASTSSIPPASAESDHPGKTWQIIGITIITVLFIATSITCAMFFDRVWKFLRDVVRCTSRPPVAEEFIPDCEKQSCHARSLSPPVSDWNKAESLHEVASMYTTTRPRELPWNTQDWNTLHRHPSRRNDHPPPA